MRTTRGVPILVLAALAAGSSSAIAAGPVTSAAPAAHPAPPSRPAPAPPAPTAAPTSPSSRVDNGGGAPPASVLSQDAAARSRMHECGHQWSAMKKAGTSGTLTWKEFSATCLVVSK